MSPPFRNLATFSIQTSFLRRYHSTEAHGGLLDLIVIGAGPGGYVAAIRAAQLGLKTACVEKRGTLGGTCLNVGCIPSKALLNNSHVYHATKTDLSKRGIDVSNVSLNLKNMLAYKDRAVGQLTKGIEYLFKKNKVEYLQGTGKLVDTDQVQVTDASGNAKTYRAKNIIIATGSDPMPFPGLNIDEKKFVTSTGALSFQTVPEKLVIIGGGIIGLELGSVWSRLGSEVTVVEYLDSIGAGMDSATAIAFHKVLAKQGIKFRLGTRVLSGALAGGKCEVEVEPAKGGPREKLVADAVLVSIGRRANTQGLGLEEIGISLDEKGRIKTDSQFRTTIPSVRAVGDVISGPMLAHKAEEEGIAAVNFISVGHGHVHYPSIPSVIYTHPEVAWTGQSEEALRAENRAYSVGNFPMLANSRAKTNEDAEGFVKILADAKTGQILGAHIIGSNAGEMIAEAVLAMQLKATAESIGNTCHAHPTMSEAFKEACMSATGLKKAIHF